MQNLQIPTAEEIRSVVRHELSDFFSKFNFQFQSELDEIGKGAEYASKITGKAVPTIYDLVHKRDIPHSKKGKDLYFSRRELLDWIKEGRRKTQQEIATEAENHQSRAFNRNRR